MKRLSTSAILLAYALFINTSAFSADEELIAQPGLEMTAQAESVLDDSSEKVMTTADEVSNTVSETSGIVKENFEMSETGNKEITSNTAKIKKQNKEKPKDDNPWAEKISGKQLNTLKAKLEALQELYNVNWRSYRIAEAINNIEKAESPMKRNASLLDDLTRQQPFTIYAVTFVFPELLEIHLQNISKHLQDKANSLVDEIVETDEEANRIINSYSDDVKSLRKINEAYISLLDKTQAVLDSIIKTNNNTANLTAFGYYLRNSNAEQLKLVSAQLNALREVAEQASFSIDYCRQQAEFITDSKESISVKGKYFAEIRSSVKDLEIFLEKYKSQQEFNFHLLSKVYNERYNELIEKVGKDEIRVGRIRKLVKKTEFKPINSSIKVLNAQEDLEGIFEKLGFKEVDTKLYETLLAYVSDASWHCRYEEPASDEEKDKQKDDKKKDKTVEKPELIDLVEDDISNTTADSNLASDSENVGSDTLSEVSPEQVSEQKEEVGDSRVETDSSGTSSEAEKVNQDHIE